MALDASRKTQSEETGQLTVPALLSAPQPGTLRDRGRETPILLAAGDCSFHHSLLLHRSGPNNTDRFRRGMASHYMSARGPAGLSAAAGAGVPGVRVTVTGERLWPG